MSSQIVYVDGESFAGIALLFGCDYVGTELDDLRNINRDLYLMEKIFYAFNYHVVAKKNVTKKEMLEICENAAQLSTFKRIVVYFTGHGSQSYSDEHHEIWLHSSDDQTLELGCTSVKLETIIKFFKPVESNNPRLVDIPRIFFIDACRRKEEISGQKSSCHKLKRSNSTYMAYSPETEENDDNKNIITCYSAAPDCVAYINEYIAGSIWTNTLILELALSDKSLKDILDNVARRLNSLTKSQKLPCATPCVTIRGEVDEVHFLRESKKKRLNITGEHYTR